MFKQFSGFHSDRSVGIHILREQSGSFNPQPVINYSIAYSPQIQTEKPVVWSGVCERSSTQPAHLSFEDMLIIGALFSAIYTGFPEQ